MWCATRVTASRTASTSGSLIGPPEPFAPSIVDVARPADPGRPSRRPRAASLESEPGSHPGGRMVKKVIAVTGATGAQGGGLARSILADSGGDLSVRALTRKPDSEKARDLARRGAQVVAADMDDVASLRKAFEGAHGAYCVTPFWEHMDPAREAAQIGAMAKAAKDAGVRHVVWSTLEDTRRLVPLSDARMP